MATRVTFRMGDLFDPDDVVGRWVATLAMIWNDLALTNRRLMAGFDSGAEPHETVHDARAMASAVWEGTKYLRCTQDEPSVAAFMAQLPENVLADYRDALAATEPPEIEPGDPESEPREPRKEFRARLAAMRDLSSHYAELDRKHVKKALTKLADKEGLILSGGRFIDVRYDFADQLAANLVFDAERETWEEEFKDFATTLSEVVLPLLTFLQALLVVWHEQHEDAITVTSE